jgi:S-adenosylmethionine-diacylgycerolhomoserine-N-methlytransferase
MSVPSPAIENSASPAADLSSAELMDRIYARQRHVYDLTRKYYLLGRDRLIRELKPPRGGAVLEIGCGTGRNLVAAARAYPDARLYGLDVSTKMLATARANLRQTRLEDRIRLGCADAADFDAEKLFGREGFDRVFFSYSLSMIPAWQEALKQAHGVVAPDGGELHLVDFGQQERLPGWFRRALFAWLERFHVAPRAELEKTLLTLARERGGLARFDPLYRGYADLGAIVRRR